MIGQVTFFWYVRQVFGQLDDPSYLVGHPLATLLVETGQIGATEGLRQALLRAVDQLRPPPGTPAGSGLDRRWRTLTLRHVEGFSFKQIAQQLQVSERQALRDHKSGVEAVATILWERYRRATTGLVSDSHRSRLPVASDLESELARVSSLSSEDIDADLGDAVADALATTRNLGLARGAEVVPLLPAGAISVAVEPLVLRQILTCLLSAAFLSGMAPRLEIGAATLEDSVKVTMTIQGRPPSPLDREADIAEMDALIESARRLTELRGGLLQVRETSKLERRFVLQLAASRPSTILVIDDNPDLADLFQWYLTGTGHRVIPARAPSTALRLARDLQPDLIILDVMLPGQDGWQLLRELARDEATRGIPVIICSILPERTLALSLGVADFLAKPVTQPALLAALEKCLGPRRGAAHPGCSGGTASPHRR